MKQTRQAPSDIVFFTDKLKHYKRIIDRDIAAYSRQLKKTILQQYGAHSRLATDVYLDMLLRGGKRIRGALSMVGYEMTGGTDQKMIIQAARAVEMIHAYILIIDDINDRSPTRRGGPTAHRTLAEYHARKNWADESEHFGESIAMNAALLGNHTAHLNLAKLDVPPELRIKAIATINESMVTTAHGQFNDISNEVAEEVTERDVMNVMEWKTAYYTFLNPLKFGMVLANASQEATGSITDYCINAGKAFQITDDILGTFGEEFESGKSPLDDIKEGKRTLLAVYALQHAKRTDKNFLIQMLGNHKLTPTQFNRCKDIFVETGALDYAKNCAQKHVSFALGSLDEQKSYFSNDGARFLRGLAEYLIDRRA